MNEETNETVNNANGGESSFLDDKTYQENKSEIAAQDTQTAENPPSNEAAKPAKKKKSAKKAAAAPSEVESVQFVGKIMRWNKKLAKQEKVVRESPAFIIDGRQKIMLPADLHKGATLDVETAQRVRNLFPDDFKTPTAK